MYGTNLVRNADKDTFPIPGYPPGKRKHMGFDHVFFNICKHKIACGVLHRPFRMGEDMMRIAFFLLPPVVQIIVVQQCTPDQGFWFHRHAEKNRNAKAHARHGHTMRVCAGFSVMRCALLQLHAGDCEADPTHNPADRAWHPVVRVVSFSTSRILSNDTIISGCNEYASLSPVPELLPDAQNAGIPHFTLNTPYGQNAILTNILHYFTWPGWISVVCPYASPVPMYRNLLLDNVL